MEYVNTPLEFRVSENDISVKRNVGNLVKVLDNLVELIVFTPRGTFDADPDFGFEYWNHEYSNIHSFDFGKGNLMVGRNGNLLYSDTTKKKCQESICRSIEAYVPQLKHIDVSIELNPVNAARIGGRHVMSKYEIFVKVVGMLDDDLGTAIPYEKSVLFFMEPTVKRVNI